MNRAIVVTLLSAAAFVGGAVPMARRISTFNKEAHLASFHIEPFASRKIHLEGFPPVEIQDRPALPEEHLPPDASFLKVIYGELPNAREALVPVHKPAALDIPKLDIYEEWAKLLAINEVQRDAAGNPHVKPGSEHLVLAVRRTPEGFDADTWGSVRRTEWLFDFWEFKPDGTIAKETYRWPMANPMHEDAFQKRAAEAAARNPPDLRLKSIADIPVLPERGYVFQAAMHVIPKLAVPKHKFNDTALSFHTLGWTLPVVMISGLIFSVAVFFAIAPVSARKLEGSAAPRS